MERRRTREESEAQTAKDIKAIYKFSADFAISETWLMQRQWQHVDVSGKKKMLLGGEAEFVISKLKDSSDYFFFLN